MNTGITPIKTINESLATKIANETCILEVHRQEPSFQKKVASELLLNGPNESVDPKRLYVTKSLITSAELKRLNSHRTRFFDDLKLLSLPSGMLTIGSGQYLILVAMIEEVKARIDTYLSERDNLLDDFQDRYPEIIEAAKERLGPLFNASDYPPFPEIRASYNTTYKFLSNTVPEEIQRVSQELYERERERVFQMCQDEARFIQDSLREKFLELVNHFSDRLTADENTGKQKRFHGSNLKHLEEFAETFRKMNLTGDHDLELLVGKVSDLVGGVDPNKVRTDAEFREEMEKAFSDIKDAAGKLVVEHKRKVILT